jgi:Rhamnan synthesis protein F
LRRLLVLITSLIACYLYDLKLHVGDLPAILRRKHLRTRAYYRGKLTLVDKPSRVALIALLPSDESIPFTVNLAEALVANDFYVVAVCNKVLPPHHRDALIPRCHYLIERFPIGRDFGSYKFGLLWLRQHGDVLAKADTLLLANDSMFYPACTKALISKLVNRDGQWLCLFENFEIHYHTQAFLQIFRRDVFDSKAFKRFWGSYVPFSSRTHSIRRGEAGLTQALVKAGFFAWPFYNALDLIKAIRESLRAEAVEAGQVANLLTELYSDTPRLKRRGFLRSTAVNGAIKRIEELMHNSNPTHSCGLIANVILGAPVKRDVCYRGAYDITLLMRTVKGFTPDEMSCMYVDLRKRGVPAGIQGFRRLLFMRGQI